MGRDVSTEVDTPVLTEPSRRSSPPSGRSSPPPTAEMPTVAESSNPKNSPPAGTPSQNDNKVSTSRLRLQPGAVIGRYVVVQRIGEGGMGAVALGFDSELSRRVALKAIHPSIDT